MRVAAVVVASGEGQRMAERWRFSPFAGVLSVPVAKQFLPVLGRPLVYYSLDVFDRCEAVEGVVLVVRAGDVEYAWREVVRRYRLRKVMDVVPGGSTRRRSVHAGLRALKSLEPPWDLVVVHDGVRPLVTQQLVLQTVEQACRYGAATVGTPAEETVKLVDQRGLVFMTPDRRRLWNIQTPQAFRFELLWQAHERAEAWGLEATDDCTLVEALGQPVRVLAGSRANLKVTVPEDLVMVEALLSRGWGDRPVEESFHSNGG
ncbi:MAG TPA: 2-C-methyl-D-erythritol 4-phosphate cytidylyltransferase [Limnochordales bacterium]